MVRLKAVGVLSPGLVRKFQFHNGSIKGIRSERSVSVFLTSFNSTMVRLKVLFVRVVLLCISSFNSTMVRLKGPTPTHRKLDTQFQFHNGSIKGI